jgi:hypothetical protein
VLEKNACTIVEWPDDIIAKKKKNPSLYAGQQVLSSVSSSSTLADSAPPALTSWFGSPVGTDFF